MFDDKTKDLYKSIKVPVSLHERVLKLEAEARNAPEKAASAPNHPISLRSFRSVLAFAASLLIIAAAVLTSVVSRSPAVLTVGGSEIADSPIQIAAFVAMNVRIAPDIANDERATLTFALDGEGDNTVRVTQGDISGSADGSRHSEDVRKIIISGGGEIYWRITPGTSATITIERGLRKTTYALEPVGDSGVWTITKSP
jgi:hypothetical protein